MPRAARLPSVLVDSALVQASGLLKDDIALSIPTEDGAFDTVLLTEAVKKVRASSAAWEQYAQELGAVRAGAGRDGGCGSAPGRTGG